MGYPNRDQVIRIVLLALTAATVCRAQRPVSAPSAAGASAEAAPAAVVSLPADAPVTPPKVICTGDQMTISANNSTLSSVLAEVHRCMGTRIDIPDAAGTKRMFDHIGPGPASQVLEELLSNTGYNYVIGSSPANEDKVESIMLLARTAELGALAPVDDPRANSLSRRAFMQMHQASIPHPMTDADNAAIAAPAAEVVTPEPAPADAAATPAPAGTEAQPTPSADPSAKPADAAPAAAPGQPEASPTSPPTTSPTTGRPTTTQDQITNMQQMFELRKQMNQQTQNTAPPQQ